MRLSEYQIENYKSIEQGNFDAADTTVIIGKNNSGKSNIINSIEDFPKLYEIATNGIHADNMPEKWFESAIRGKDTTGVIKYNLTFELSESEYSRVLDKIRDGIENSQGRVRSRNPVETDMKEIIDKGWLSKIRISLSCGSRRSNDIEMSKSVLFDDDYIPLGELRRENNVFGDTNPQNTINDIIPDSIPTWEFVDPVRRPRNVMPAGRCTSLNSDGENLVKVLDYLSSNKPELFSNVSDAYVDVMEGVSDLRTEYDEDSENPQDVTIVVEENSFEIKFKAKEISSGSKEVLSLLTQAFLSSEDTDILLLEEPELHLHPAAEQKIFNLLRTISEDHGTQIILSTHSDVFVDQVEVENIVRTERDGETEIRNISEGELERELTDLGYEQSSILQAEGVVLVEGRSDRLIIRELCETADIDIDEKEITIVELEGEGNIERSIRSLVKVLFSFDIPYLFVIDSHGDDPSDVESDYIGQVNRSDDEDSWYHTEPRHFHIWSGYGIEEYLMSPDAISSALNAERDDVEDSISDAEDNSEINGENKEEILEHIYERLGPQLKRSEKAYSKDQHGPNIATHMSEEDLHSEVEELMDKIDSLPSEHPQSNID